MTQRSLFHSSSRLLIALVAASGITWLLFWALFSLIKQQLVTPAPPATTSISFASLPEQPIAASTARSEPPPPVLPQIPQIPSPLAVNAPPQTPQLRQQRPPLSQVTPSLTSPDLSQLTALPVAAAAAPPSPASSAPQVAPTHDQGLIPLVRVKPIYPVFARQRGIEGQVTLSFTITAEGRVKNPEVISASPSGVFERNALRAIRRWRFKPKHSNGQAVAQRVTQTIEFAL